MATLKDIAKSFGETLGNPIGAARKAAENIGERIDAANAAMDKRTAQMQENISGAADAMAAGFNRTSGNAEAAAARQAANSAAAIGALNKGVEDGKGAFSALVDAAKALGSKAVEIAKGGKGEIGGVAGGTMKAAGKSMSMGSNIVKGAAGFVTRNPALALGAAAVTGAVALFRRSKANEIEQTAQLAEQVEIERARQDALRLRGQHFDNPQATTGHAARAGAAAQMAAAHGAAR